MMIACHPVDLDADRGVGFRTALVRRPREWGDGPDATLEMLAPELMPLPTTLKRRQVLGHTRGFW